MSSACSARRVALAASLWAMQALAQTSGLDQRPSNTTCLAPARPTGGSSVAAIDAFPTAPAFVEPVKLLQAPGNGTRWFVLEKAGRVRSFLTSSPSTVTTWLDINSRVNPSGEGGLLGMAFHPDYPAVPEVFLSYTASGSPLVSRISRFVLDTTTTPVSFVEQILLTVNQPFTNHNGGDIAFGPDRSLYIGFGDGGSGGDPGDHAQDTTDLLGSMLRINVIGVPVTERYRIPVDNPFATMPRCGPGTNAQNCPEIFAWGLRNPWRWSFDPQTGALWAADVGQGSWEEIDVIERGGNFGWRCEEGLHDYDPSGCPAGGFTNPVLVYDHSVGNSITGGFVYRGSAITALRGRYVFGDFGAGWVAALRDDGSGGYVREELFDNDNLISSFGQGTDGEIYFVDFGSGRILKLVPGGTTATDPVPTSLAATGCVVSTNPTQPASGLVPFGVNAPFWSDNAVKSRWLGLPDGTFITRDAQEDWQFPARTVLMKNFRIGSQLVETRLLMRHPDGVWRGYTYEWNDAQTAATRVLGGKTRLVQGQQWIYPSEGQCLQCHTAAAGYALGLETSQLNRTHLYPTTGRTANQLDTLSAIGMFSTALPPAVTLPRLADPASATYPLHERARAWLHTNCANCHRPGGLTPVNMDLRVATALQSMNSCNVTPTSGDLGITGAMRFAPGDSSHSVLASRISRRDAAGMPPLASSLVDATSAAMVSTWIDSLRSCTDSDLDGVDDRRDNCRSARNSSQKDADADTYGNFCDADLDNSGLTTTTDFNLLRACINRLATSSAQCAAADLDDSGLVTVADYNVLRSRINTAPGPGASP